MVKGTEIAGSGDDGATRHAGRGGAGDQEAVALVRQVAQAQHDAARARASLERLAELCRPVALRIAWTYAPREADAADMAQEILLTLMSHLPRLRDPVAFPRWFSRVAHTTCGQWLRRERARGMDYSLHVPVGEPALALPDLAGSLAYDAVDLRDLLSQLGKTLTPRAREAVSLTYLAGLPQREVGQRLGISPRAVEGLLYRALRQLQDVMAHCSDEAEELETWCSTCGEEHLRGYLRPGESPQWPLHLQATCPKCAPGHYWWFSLPLAASRYSSLETALDQGSSGLEALTRRLLRTPAPPCPSCATPLRHTRFWQGDDYRLQWSCPHCGHIVQTSVLTVATALPAWRAFHQSSARAVVLPQRALRRGAGMDIVAGVRDLTSERTLTLTVDGDSLRVCSLEVEG